VTDFNALIGGGGGAVGGLVAGLFLARKFSNGVKKVCPAQITLDEMHNACVLLRQAVERNSAVSERATDALLTVVRALSAMKGE